MTGDFASTPAISYILIHYGTAEYTSHAVRSLRGVASASLFEVIVVDNGSHPPLMEMPDVDRIVRVEENHGYAAACNAGARAAKGPLLFFLNNDIDMHEDAASPLLEAIAQDPGIGVAAPALSHADGRFQLSYGEDPGLASEFLERRRQRQSRAEGGSAYEQRIARSQRERDVDWVSGAAMLVTRACYSAVDGFDEAYRFYFEDADFCRRARKAGYRIRYVPSSRMIHFGGGSQEDADPCIERWYRYGQLRYYALHRSHFSFVLLKLYFFFKYILFIRPDPELRKSNALLFRELWKAQYTNVTTRASN